MAKQEDIIADSVIVHGKTCNGCDRTKTDVMIGVRVTREDGTYFFEDIFLTNDQANQLAIDLGKQVSENHLENFKTTNA